MRKSLGIRKLDMKGNLSIIFMHFTLNLNALMPR